MPLGTHFDVPSDFFPHNAGPVCWALLFKLRSADEAMPPPTATGASEFFDPGGSVRRKLRSSQDYRRMCAVLEWLEKDCVPPTKFLTNDSVTCPDMLYLYHFSLT